MKDEILKPCPFCGNEDIIVDRCTVRVTCRKCFASGPLITKYLINGRTERQAAIASWNDRRSNTNEVDRRTEERGN